MCAMFTLKSPQVLAHQITILSRDSTTLSEKDWQYLSSLGERAYTYIYIYENENKIHSCCPALWLTCSCRFLYLTTTAYVDINMKRVSDARRAINVNQLSCVCCVKWLAIRITRACVKQMQFVHVIEVCLGSVVKNVYFSDNNEWPLQSSGRMPGI